jgi:hypothetical protein
LIGTVLYEGDPTEKFLFVVGLNGGSDSSGMDPMVCQISLDRTDQLETTLSYTDFEIHSEAAACVMGSRCYLVGVGPDKNELWKWEQSSGWVQCQDMTSGRRRHCMAAVDTTLYVLGGWVKAHGSLNSVLSYDTEKNRWNGAGRLVYAVHSAACVVYKKSIYLFGGMDADCVEVSHVQNYDPYTNKCTLLDSTMPQPCALMRAVLWENSAILLDRDTCLVYNLVSQTWTERKQFKTDVVHFAVAIHNEVVYVAGGGASYKQWFKEHWTCRDEINSVAVLDIVNNTQGSTWKHYARLPKCAMVDSFCTMSLPEALNI